MGGTTIETAWHDLADQILSHWPDLEAGHLLTTAGDRAAFARYLSATYDLSPLEALEAVERWLVRLHHRAAA
ncbi:MAG: hypothetical protein AAGA87_00615 [Pseudomonadota bacterium]